MKPLLVSCWGRRQPGWLVGDPDVAILNDHHAGVELRIKRIGVRWVEERLVVLNAARRLYWRLVGGRTARDVRAAERKPQTPTLRLNVRKPAGQLCASGLFARITFANLPAPVLAKKTSLDTWKINLFHLVLERHTLARAASWDAVTPAFRCHSRPSRYAAEENKEVQDTADTGESVG